MNQTKRVAEHVTFICEECRDIFSAVVWVRRRGDGRLTGVLERTSSVTEVDGRLTHRPGHCNGEATPYNLSEKIHLER